MNPIIARKATGRWLEDSRVSSREVRAFLAFLSLVLALSGGRAFASDRASGILLEVEALRATCAAKGEPPPTFFLGVLGPGAEAVARDLERRGASDQARGVVVQASSDPSASLERAFLDSGLHLGYLVQIRGGSSYSLRRVGACPPPPEVSPGEGAAPSERVQGSMGPADVPFRDGKLPDGEIGPAAKNTEEGRAWPSALGHQNQATRYILNPTALMGEPWTGSISLEEGLYTSFKLSMGRHFSVDAGLTGGVLVLGMLGAGAPFGLAHMGFKAGREFPHDLHLALGVKLWGFALLPLDAGLQMAPYGVVTWGDADDNLSFMGGAGTARLVSGYTVFSWNASLGGYHRLSPSWGLLGELMLAGGTDGEDSAIGAVVLGGMRCLSRRGRLSADLGGIGSPAAIASSGALLPWLSLTVYLGPSPSKTTSEEGAHPTP